MKPETEKLIEYIKTEYNVSDLCDLDSGQWDNIAQDEELNEEFIEMYADEFDWYVITGNQELSESFIEEHIDYIEDFGELFYGQDLSEHFIEKYADKENENEWYWISGHQNLSVPFIKKHRDIIDFNQLLMNYKIDLNRKISKLEKHPEWLDILFLTAKKEPEAFLKRINIDSLKEKLVKNVFWESYVNYLKEEYPDKKVFEVKLVETIDTAVKMFNLDKKDISNALSGKKKEKIPELS